MRPPSAEDQIVFSFVDSMVWIRDVLVVAEGGHGAYSTGKSKTDLLGNREGSCRALKRHGVVWHMRFEISYGLHSGRELVRRDS